MDNKKDMRWKVLDSEYLIKRPWLTARRDKCLLPTGAVHEEYYILEYPDWINVIAQTTDGDFVFVRQYRHGLGETAFEIVAGVIEEGEEPLHAAQRELLEETGFGGGEWEKIMTLSPNASAMNNHSHSFLVKGVTKQAEQHLDQTEDIEVYRFTREEVVEMLQRGEIQQALMAAPLWKCIAEGKI